MNWTDAVAILVAAAVGFLGGLLTFKRSLVWCKVCGLTLRCPNCRPAPKLVDELPPSSAVARRA